MGRNAGALARPASPAGWAPASVHPGRVPPVSRQSAAATAPAYTVVRYVTRPHSTVWYARVSVYSGRQIVSSTQKPTGQFNYNAM